MIIKEDLKTIDIDEKRAYINKAGEQKNLNALTTLIKLLSTEKDLICEILWALGKIGSRDACEPILTFINHDDIRIKGACAEALGEISCNTQSAINALFLKLNDDSDYVHWQASWALGKIGYRHSETQIQIVKKIIEKLSEDELGTKWHYVYALGMIGDRSAVGVLTKMLENNVDINLKRNILFALKNILDPESRDIFEIYKNDEDSEVRHYVNEALHSFYDENTDCINQV
jgi:HEAT repeat protein